MLNTTLKKRWKSGQIEIFNCGLYYYSKLTIFVNLETKYYYDISKV